MSNSQQQDVMQQMSDKMDELGISHVCLIVKDPDGPGHLTLFQGNTLWVIGAMEAKVFDLKMEWASDRGPIAEEEDIPPV